MSHYDVIIIGVGSMGVSTTAYLGMAGVKVLALDPYIGPHDHGSHSGKTRIIRQSYFEHPSYVPLLFRSYTLWRELENLTNTTSKIVHQTGLLYMGPERSMVIEGVKASAAQYDLSLKKVQQMHFNISSEWQIWMEEQAGYLDVHTAFQSYLSLFHKKAVDFRNEKLLSWKQNNGRIEIQTSSGKHTGDKIIFTAGSWSADLLKEFTLPLRVTKQVVAWLDVGNNEKYKENHFPCWFVHDPEKGMYYGFPISTSTGFELKLGLHKPGEAIDPNQPVRLVNTNEMNEITYFIENYLPELKVNQVRYETCLYTYSPDENFILDYLPDSDEKVLVACGFSGHGFKFVPVIGEILTNLVIGKANMLEIDFLKLGRFNK